jgi:heme exporter protein D
MMFGAHWGYWLALGLSLVALALDQVRRARRRRRVWRYAFDEQLRREVIHPLPYRPDQRVRAIQQRLSRSWGKRALSSSMRRRIEEELARGVDQ